MTYIFLFYYIIDLIGMAPGQKKTVILKSKSTAVSLNVPVTRVQSNSVTLPSKISSTQIQSTTFPPNFKKNVTLPTMVHTTQLIEKDSTPPTNDGIPPSTLTKIGSSSISPNDTVTIESTIGGG